MRLRETVVSLIKAWPGIREARADARPRWAAIRRLKKEPSVRAELRCLTGRHLSTAVHTALMGDAPTLIMICGFNSLANPRGIINVLMTSRAFTAGQRAHLEELATQLDDLLGHLNQELGSDDTTLLGLALTGDGQRFDARAREKGVNSQEVLTKLEALPHLDEYGLALIRFTRTRLPSEHPLPRP